MKIKLGFCISILIFSVSFLNAQIIFEEIIDRNDPLNNVIFIYQQQEDEKILIDSFKMFINHSDYSYAEYNGTIYISWSSYDYQSQYQGYGKNFYIVSYDISQNSLVLKEKISITDKIPKKLLLKEISVTFTSLGLNFSFQKGKIKELVLSYEHLNLDEIPMILKKIEKLY